MRGREGPVLLYQEREVLQQGANGLEVPGGRLSGRSRKAGMPHSRAGLWRRASFSAKFAAVILIAGLVMSAVPFWLSQNATNTQALDRAADKVGVAANVLQQQHQALTAFTAGVARQVTTGGLLADPSNGSLVQALKEDATVNSSSDVVGVILPAAGVVALNGSRQLAAGDPMLAHVTVALRDNEWIVAGAQGAPWLLASSPVEPGGTVAFVAQPLSSLLTNITGDIATAADPADLMLLRNGVAVADTTVAGKRVPRGSALPGLQDAVSTTQPALASLNGTDMAVAALPVPHASEYTIAVVTPVSAAATAITPLLVLVALILAAMLIIVVVVQTELQRPLRRLYRAVAALARGQFDAPLPAGRDDELGRLAETFDAMRVQLHSTMRVAAARASVATELSLSQPLEQALEHVVKELRASVLADAALIVVSGSEMSDPFAIVEGVEEIDIDSFLAADGPLGEGYRYSGAGALLVSAAPSSREAALGVREFCVAPLRIGSHVHGVVAVANRSSRLFPPAAELVGSIAEQVALALERYRFLAMVQRQASTDDLTGLYNHRFLVDYLGQQVALAERLNAPLAVLMLDIDHFKELNDTHGHQAGDSALAVFAQTLLHSVRTSDLAARYGGEEFAVVMYNTRSAEARLVAEKIRFAVSQAAIELPDRTRLSLTVSIGGAAFPDDTSSARELLALADEALYRAKRAGRDRTCMVSDARRRGRGGSRPVTVVEQTARTNGETQVVAGEPHRSAQ
jgi:diguanylate cyclase (GGDEF)-like protein